MFSYRPGSHPKHPIYVNDITELPKYDGGVYTFYLLEYLRRTHKLGYIYESVDEIAKGTYVSPRQIYRGLDLLKVLGYIKPKSKKTWWLTEKCWY